MKKIISTPNAPSAIGPYSQAIEKNGILFISGQIPINPETGKIDSESIKPQTEQVLKNIRNILEYAGYTLKDVVKTTCYLSDLIYFPEMNEVYAQYFVDDPPARATVEVNRLPKDVWVEIDAIAMK